MWINLSRDIQEIWLHNSRNGPTNHVSLLHAVLKGESLTAFEVALEDARQGQADNKGLLLITNEIITAAMSLLLSFRTVLLKRNNSG